MGTLSAAVLCDPPYFSVPIITVFVKKSHTMELFLHIVWDSYVCLLFGFGFRIVNSYFQSIPYFYSLRYRILAFLPFFEKGNIWGSFLQLFYGDGVLPAEYFACLQGIAILPLFQTAVESRPVASAVPGLDADKRRSLSCGRPQAE